MDDVIDLWVNPALTAVPPAPAATVTSAVAAGDLTAVGGLLLRQGANTGNVDVDGIIVGTEWANAPLPLQLLNFTALLSDSKVNISWTTTNEINAGIFSVEKSVNGKDFKSIGTVEAKGGVSANNYSLVDERVVAGVSYYRLKMVDKDGSYKYSTIETVKTKSIGLSVYPNPVKSTITVQHEVAAKGAAVSVLTISGKPVFQSFVEAGATQTSIDAAKLAPGSYLVIFINNGVKLTKQFIKE
jgi:hypothetical protein